MKLKLCFLLLTFSLFNCANKNVPLYVGTYTSGDSEGIYKLQFNTETGMLNNKQLAVITENPSFIAYSKNKNYIYAVGEGKMSAVTAFKIKENGALQFINAENSQGKGPCHISINSNGNKAVVSNYGGGTVSLFNINTDGSLNKASQVFNHNSEDEKSHAHSALFFKNDLFVADLGRNAVYQYKLQENNFQLKSPAIVKMEENPGPRHFVLTQDGAFIYVINEYGASITSIKRTKNRFIQIDEDSTLEPDFTEFNKCADIHLSKDERFLYGSNRGENSIAVFERNTKTGTLNKIQNISVHGDWPRNFTLDPTGKFLLVANKKSNNISVFKIDATNGKLSFMHSTDLASPVCLLF